MSGTGHQSHSPAAREPSGNAAIRGYDQKIDEKVIDDFFNWPRHQAPETLDMPRLVGLLYGLLCVDISGKEALLPNPRGVAGPTGNHSDHLAEGGHRARIWFLESTVDHGDAHDELVVPLAPQKNRVYAYFDITRSRVEFKAVDAKGYELPDPPTDFTIRNNDQHPWMNFKFVRCLKKLTGLPLISEAQRNDPDLVSARIRLDTGNVAAIPPFSRDGQHNEWRVRQSNGEEVVSATTDSMLWSRPLPQGAKVRMTITPLGGGSARDVLLNPYQGALLFAATHATIEDESIATRLVHSSVFAQAATGRRSRAFPDS